MNEIGIYIHIPFCVSKCPYCSFNSYPLKKFKDFFIEKYFEKLFYEIKFFSDFNYSVKSIYIGGGTPSIVNEFYLEKIIETICMNFKINNNCEITVELNPATVSKDKLNFYKKTGINRISIGVQSFHDKFLNFLKRPYSSKEAIETVENCLLFFENVSIDLMYGIYNQTLKDLEKEIFLIKNFSVKHVSYYCLSIEKNTLFYEKGLKEISDELFSKMYDFITINLEEAGFLHYEISNFAVKDYQCIHNLNYWNYGEYLGFGAGAVSFINGRRFKKYSHPEVYINKNFYEFEEEEYIDLKKQKIEFIIMNLRKKTGIELNNYKKKFNEDFLVEFSDLISKFRNFFDIQNNYVCLNKEGFKVSNIILSEFIK